MNGMATGATIWWRPSCVLDVLARATRLVVSLDGLVGVILYPGPPRLMEYQKVMMEETMCQDR